MRKLAAAMNWRKVSKKKSRLYLLSKDSRNVKNAEKVLENPESYWELIFGAFLVVSKQTRKIDRFICI